MHYYALYSKHAVTFWASGALFPEPLL